MAEDESSDNASIITILAESDDLGPTLRAVYERGMQDNFANELRDFSKKKEEEIENLCALGYQEFIMSVDELLTLRLDVRELKADIIQMDHEIQSTGQEVLSKAESLMQLRRVRSNISTAITALSESRKVLVLCATAQEHIKAQRLYAALSTVERLQLELAPVASFDFAQQIERYIPTMKNGIKQGAQSQFNDWLVSIRGQSQRLGQLAMEQAFSQSTSVGAVRNARNTSGSKQPLAVSLTLEDDDSRGGLGSGHTGLLEAAGVDLSAVFQCHFIYSHLGLEQEFRSYYTSNRQMQCNLQCEELASATTFLESYNSALAALTGFFIVECSVRQNSGFLSSVEVDRVWEDTMKRLVQIFESKLAAVHSPAALLQVKGALGLMCQTLSTYVCTTSPLLQYLASTRTLYYKTLRSEHSRSVTNAVSATASEAPLTVLSAGDYQRQITELGLHLLPHVPPDTAKYPIKMPFSSVVSRLCGTVRAFVHDFHGFVSADTDCIDLVKQAAEQFLASEVVPVVSALCSKTTGALTVSRAALQAADVHFLLLSCSLFHSHILGLVNARSARETTLPKPLVAAGGAELLHSCTLTLQSAIMSSAAAALAPLHSYNWMSTVAIRAPGDYVKALISNLSASFQKCDHLPEDVRQAVGKHAFSHIASTIMEQLTGPAVKKFTMAAITNLTLDIDCLQQFASATFPSMGPAFEPLSSLLALFALSPIDSYADPAVAATFSPELHPQQIRVVLEKYKESSSSGGLFSHHNAASAAAAAAAAAVDEPKKKHVDALLKALRSM